MRVSDDGTRSGRHGDAAAGRQLDRCLGPGSRVAASAIAGPGLIALVALVVVPGAPLHLLGLALMPWAIAAARGAVRNARPREIAAAVWVFGLTAVVGAAGTGLAFAIAAGVVVACALATAELLVFHLPSVPDVVPDDLV